MHNKASTHEDHVKLAEKLLADSSPEGVQSLITEIDKLTDASNRLNLHLTQPDCPVVKADLIKNPPQVDAGDVENHDRWYAPLRSYLQKGVSEVVNEWDKLAIPEVSSSKMGYAGQIPHPKVLGHLNAVHTAFVEWSERVAAKLQIEKPEGMDKYEFIAHLSQILMKQGLNDQGADDYSARYKDGSFPILDMPALQAHLAKYEGSVTNDYAQQFIKDYTNTLTGAFTSFGLYDAYIMQREASKTIPDVIKQQKQELVDTLSLIDNPDAAVKLNRIDAIDDVTTESWANSYLAYLEKHGEDDFSSTAIIAKVLGEPTAAAIIGSTKLDDTLSLARKAALTQYKAVNDFTVEWVGEEQKTLQQKTQSALSIMSHVDSTYTSYRYMDDQDRANALNGILPKQMLDCFKEKGEEPFFKGDTPKDPGLNHLNQGISIALRDLTYSDETIDYHARTILRTYRELGDLSRSEYLKDALSGTNLSGRDIDNLITGHSPDFALIAPYQPSGLLGRSLARAGMSFQGRGYTFKRTKRSANTYWSHPTELFARSFEAAVQDALKNEGRYNRFLVAGTQGEMYADGQEREEMNKVIMELMKVSGPEFDRLIEMTVEQRQAELEKNNPAFEGRSPEAVA